MSTELIIAMAVVSLAGLMRGFTGAGSSMLMACFFIHIFGPVQTVGIIILMELAISAQILPSVWDKIEWPVVVPMGAIATLLMPIGSWILVSANPAILAQATGFLVLIFAFILMMGYQYQGPKPLAVSLGVGAFSGFLMAVTSFGGPPVIIYFLSSTDTSATNRANIIGYLSLTLLSIVAIMLASGNIQWETAKTALLLLPVYVITTWIGSRLFQKSNEQLYRRITIGILFCAGLYGVLQ